MTVMPRPVRCQGLEYRGKKTDKSIYGAAAACDLALQSVLSSEPGEGNGILSRHIL
jgi:hypothetical protein